MEIAESCAPERKPSTLPTSSRCTFFKPSDSNFAATQAARAASPNGGAGMRANSSCQRVNWVSWLRNHSAAAAILGVAPRCAISCCKAGADSAGEVRGDGLMDESPYYNVSVEYALNRVDASRIGGSIVARTGFLAGQLAPQFTATSAFSPHLTLE